MRITGKGQLDRELPGILERALAHNGDPDEGVDFDDMAQEVMEDLPTWFLEALYERDDQDGKWRSVEANPHTGPEWVSILLKQVGQLAESVNTYHFNPSAGDRTIVALTDELVQVIAVCAAIHDQIGLVGLPRRLA